MSEYINPDQNQNHQDLERLLLGNDDDWSVFAVDIVKSESAESQGKVALWAGTNSPVINEILGQKASESAYPFKPEQLGMLTAGHNGLYILMNRDDFEDEEKRGKIVSTLAEEAEVIAKEQGYKIHNLGDMTGEMGGIIQYALRITAGMRKLGPDALGIDYDDDFEEDEEEES